MEDKTKVSLLYMVIGGLLGLVSAVLSVYGVPNTLILIMYGGVVYLTTYQYHLVGVKFERLGEKRWRSALGGIIPSLLPWLVIWTMLFYMIGPVILLTGASYTESAEDLQEYLESNGVRAKISDNYTRYLFSHRVVIFGSRVPLPLGTSYGATAFPDSIQRFLRLEREKKTVIEEKIDSGELLIIRKPARTILVVSDLTGDVGQVVQDNKETIYNLLIQ